MSRLGLTVSLCLCSLAWFGCGPAPVADAGTGGSGQVGGGTTSSTGGGSASTGGGSTSTGGGSASTGGGSASTGGGSASTGGGSASTGGGSNTGGGTAGLANGAACTVGTACQSGQCVEGVCCNRACDGTCEACTAARTSGTDGTCAPLSAGTECRASAGTCDLAETCDGVSGQCPFDAKKPATTVCRASNGPCDVGETCTGSTVDCPADALADAGVVCRAAVGVCDRAEICDGTSTLCPGDSKQAAGTVCRPAAGRCDVAEVCNGSSDGCDPVDLFLPATSLACAPYRCTGSTADCATSCGGDSSCAPDRRAICVNGHCETGRLVFVTSTQYSPNFGGVDAGDTICQAHANDAGFGGTFRAWLSDPTTSPAQRFVRDGGIYIRMDKQRIATDWADLTNGLSVAVGYTEKSTIPDVGTRHIFTGTTAAGNFMTVSGGNQNTNCSNWTNATAAFNGAWGQCDAINTGAPSWTSNGPSACQSLVGGRFYCFEQ